MAIVKIKRSITTSTPANGSLEEGELAYSFVSKKLFIGDSSKNPKDIITDYVNDLLIDGGTF